MEQFDFLESKKFLDALQNKKVALFINPGMPEVTWDEVLNFVNDPRNPRLGTRMVPNEHAFFYNQAQKIDSVNSFVKHVHSKFKLHHEDDKTLTCQLFGTTMLGDGNTIFKHDDSENNLFWQGKGKSRWRLYESYETDKPFMDVILEEGDVLFVPSHTIHYVEPITPRFGFAVLFDTYY